MYKHNFTSQHLTGSTGSKMASAYNFIVLKMALKIRNPEHVYIFIYERPGFDRWSQSSYDLDKCMLYRAGNSQIQRDGADLQTTATCI